MPTSTQKAGIDGRAGIDGDGRDSQVRGTRVDGRVQGTTRDGGQLAVLTGVCGFPEVGALVEVRLPGKNGLGTLWTKVLVGTAADAQSSDDTVP
jgi:hypothetical protein